MGINEYTILVFVYSVVILVLYLKLKSKTKEIINNNELRKAFADADNSIIYLKDENLKYIFVNKATEDLYNRKDSEIIGGNPFDLLDKDLELLQRETDLEVLKQLTQIRSEVKLGDVIYRINKFPVKLLNGEYGVGAIIEDITDASNKLRESKDNLQLILNSTAEAIYGIDKNGCCTFCNRSCLEILGYSHHDELIGKNMHLQIHHSYKDGKPMSFDECSVLRALRTGKCTHADDEVFWTADGRSFDVEYWSYPQFKDEEVIGAVVTFVDITERRMAEEEIKYLSYHDVLTGLYNKLYFQTELKRLDVERNLPISIIMGDANGLKLTNDIFGHTAGDELLIKVAEAFKKVCRKDDIIARIGGDEFIILLPKTELEDARKIMGRIKDEISTEQIFAIKASISMGTSTKVNINQNILTIMEDAENRMYQDKSTNRKNINTNQIRKIIETLHGKHPREGHHSINVSKLSQDIGLKMNLSNEEIKKLKDAGYHHDIGKIVLKAEIIENGPITDEDLKEYKQHPVVGYRILNSFDETLDLAELVFSHHEHWDGTGFPKGLKGNEIPLLARIIAIAEYYDGLTNELNKFKKSKTEVIEDIKKESGLKFDPKVVEIFVEMMQK